MRLSDIFHRLSPWQQVRQADAHCDIPCGIYDPEQARIEAESCLKIIEKYHDSDDPIFRDRCIIVKEERAGLAKHHISVLWSDRYKPEKHDDQFPHIKDTFNQAVKACSDVKRGVDVEDAKRLLDLIDEIDEWWKADNGPEETRVAGRPG
jgi:nickel superoxide dismutase